MGQDPASFFLLTPEGKGIYGIVSPNGILTFAVEAGEGCSIRGTELFNRMMQYFGESVKEIQGVWRKAHSESISTNIDKVNELTATGIRLEEAIHYAWTVTRAKKLGYTKVQVLNQPEGSPGAYTKVDVLIER